MEDFEVESVHRPLMCLVEGKLLTPQSSGLEVLTVEPSGEVGCTLKSLVLICMLLTLDLGLASSTYEVGLFKGEKGSWITSECSIINVFSCLQK